MLQSLIHTSRDLGDIMCSKRRPLALAVQAAERKSK